MPVLLVAPSDVAAQHSGVEGGCLASALGWRGRVGDAWIARDSWGAEKSLPVERSTAWDRALPLLKHCRVWEGMTMWNGRDAMGSGHSACVSHLSCPLCRCAALHNVKASSPRGSCAIPKFAMGRALWDTRVKAD